MPLWESASDNTWQGIIVDISCPIAGGPDELWEEKCMHEKPLQLSHLRPWLQTAPEHLIPSQDYRGVGPLQQRMFDLGGCHQLVVGANGGVNRNWHDLIGRLTDSAAPSRWSFMLCRKVSDAAGVLRQCKQRRLCFTMARERSRFRSSRLSLLCGAGRCPLTTAGVGSTRTTPCTLLANAWGVGRSDKRAACCHLD